MLKLDAECDPIILKLLLSICDLCLLPTVHIFIGRFFRDFLLLFKMVISRWWDLELFLNVLPEHCCCLDYLYWIFQKQLLLFLREKNSLMVEMVTAKSEDHWISPGNLYTALPRSHPPSCCQNLQGRWGIHHHPTVPSHWRVTLILQYS